MKIADLMKVVGLYATATVIRREQGKQKIVIGETRLCFFPEQMKEETIVLLCAVRSMHFQIYIGDFE